LSAPERRAALIDTEGGADRLKRARALCDALANLKPSPDFPYEEPDELEQIRAHRPDGPRHIAAPLSDEQLDDKTLGAWLGRAAGCMLGKPVEGWRREKMVDLLAAKGYRTLAVGRRMSRNVALRHGQTPNARMGTVRRES